MANSYIPHNDNIKLYTIAILSLFDELVLMNQHDDPYTIPLYFGQSNRKVARTDAKQGNKPYPNYGQILPAMSLSVEGFDYNPERATNKMLKKKRISLDNGEEAHMVSWNDVNVDINFNLKIVAKNVQDLFRIIEYITTVFINSKYYVDVKHTMYDQPISTPIILNSDEFVVDMNEDIAETNRVVESNLSFTIKGIFTNNIQSMTKRILTAKLRVWKDLRFDELIQEYNISVDDYTVPGGGV